MTRQEYYEFREELSVLNKVEKYSKMFNEFLLDNPAFWNMTILECFKYYSRRAIEQNNKIGELMNYPHLKEGVSSLK